MIDSQLYKKRREGRSWFDSSEMYSFHRLRASDVTAVDLSSLSGRDIYSGIGVALNKDTGLRVEFVSSAYKRILRNRLFDPRMMGKLSVSFRDAVYFGKGIPDKSSEKPNVACSRVFRGKMKIERRMYTLVFIVHDIKRAERRTHQLYTIRIYRYF